MSITLKDYQQKSVDSLKEYIKKIHEYRPNNEEPNRMAFITMINRPYKDYGINSPSICIKIPTGGGKTLIACESINIIHRFYFKRTQDNSLVVWLVPTEAILEQTIRALRDTKHGYRQALGREFKNIKIFDVDCAQLIKKSDIQNSLCIIVSTYATFRIESSKRNKRNVYKENGNLKQHFDGASHTAPTLHEVIKLYAPIIILDEAHHAKTVITYEMIREFNPGFVAEFTATPHQHEPGKESNVLVNVKAVELKREGMIKMPIMHVNEPTWTKTVDLGVKQRHILEKKCKTYEKTHHEYIRPIALIQAERDDSRGSDSIDVIQIKNYLIDEHNIPEREIAIKTGTKDNLKGKDLLSKFSKIRYIITVQALAEGWDNPFAYVLISIMNNKSETAGEQMLGRILRMPRQNRKHSEELNCAYVFTSSQNFGAIVNKLQGELIKSGYGANDMINSKGKLLDVVSIKQVIPDPDIKLPCISFVNSSKYVLDYEDLVNKSVELDKKPTPKIGNLVSAAGKVKHDVSVDGLSKTVIQETFDTNQQGRDNRKNLMNALRRTMRRKWINADDMNAYLGRIIDEDLKCSENQEERMTELTKDITTVVDSIERDFEQYESDSAKKRFDELRKQDRIGCKFKPLTPTMTLPDPLPNHHQKHLYDRLEKMDEPEEFLALDFARLQSVKWWYRNPVRNENSFFIPGWENRLIYPDFVIKTNKGKYFIVEYKGGQFKGSDDVEYKKNMLKILSELAGDNYDARVIFDTDVNTLINDIKRS